MKLLKHENRKKEKHASESDSILNTMGPSSPCNFIISGNPLNRNQENPVTSGSKLRPSGLHEIMLGHLNGNSLRNKFESVSDIIQGTFEIFLLPKTKIKTCWVGISDHHHHHHPLLEKCPY